jgi:hypothetical protein
VRGQPLDRRHGVAVRLRGKHQTRTHGAAIDQHRTRAALPFRTALFRARQMQLIAQDVELGVVRAYVQLFCLAVDGHRERNGRWLHR